MQAYRLAAEKEWTSARCEVRREDICFPPALEGEKKTRGRKEQAFSSPRDSNAELFAQGFWIFLEVSIADSGS